MTLNGVMAVILRYSTEMNSVALEASCVIKVIEDGLILCATKMYFKEYGFSHI